MASAPDAERFKGTSWEECHDFIAAVRARALWEGKQRDPGWMADFAAPLFWGKALSWHLRLPLDICQDWFKLAIALADRWPSPEDEDEPEVRPTPAAAPSINRDDKANRPLQGALKVVADGSNTIHYVKQPVSGSPCGLTRDASEALRVRCNSLSSPTLLERIDHSCHSWLVDQWRNSTPNIGDGSTDYGGITCLNRDSLKSIWGGDKPCQLITCTVSANGEVVPVWQKGDSIGVALSFFVNDDDLYIVTDPVVYGQRYSDEKRAKLFIEPID